MSSIRGTISSVGEVILGAGDSLCAAKKSIEESEAFNSVKKCQKDFDEEIKSPFKELYRKVPQQMTNFKFNNISMYSYNERFATLNLLCMATAILTFRSVQSVNLVSRSLRAFRNSGVVYFAGGLMIAPEIYNPLMKDE